MLRQVHDGILVSVALVATAVPAIADVTISSAATQNMSCAAGLCSPTAPAAVLNVKDLQSLLAGGAVKVITTGAGVQATSIRLATNLSWSGANALTLDAYKSVTVDRPMEAKGGAGLSVYTNDGGRNGEFSFGAGGHVTFADTNSALAINGTSYVLVSSLSTLASAIAANPAGAYALANSYDASQDGTYATPPVSTVFGGTFNGLGNAISNLTINDPTEDAYVGLFAQSSGGAILANIRLEKVNVTGGSGSSEDYSTESVGGLVGYGNGIVSHTFVSGTVSAGQYASVGGLVGIGPVHIARCNAATNVWNGIMGNAGGLIGGTGAGASISDSKATGVVSGYGFVGGLVGFNYVSSISHSAATGEITGDDEVTYAGGLAGINESGLIATSYATGTVQCQYVCGGLAGIQQPSDSIPGISRSFATGNVTGSNAAGGLIGVNNIGTISDSYATGAASAPTAGGVAGYNVYGENGAYSFKRSYSSGTVAGSTDMAGGVIGVDQFPSMSKQTYWDTTTSGITNKWQGAGNVADDPGLKGLSNRKLQSGLPRGFNPRVWTENPDINGGLPYLIDNPPPK